jgi:ribonuclease HII
MSFIIGIDEAGRGPLAGPVAVGAVKIPAAFNRNLLKGIKDSKQLTETERESWFKLARHAKSLGELDFAVSLVSEKVIDKHGISYAIRLGIKRCLKKLDVTPEDSQIFLDGALKAPSEFSHQLTIIKGDEKVPVISLASVMAKVTRDRRMVNLAKKYPEYAFETHKGYGTLVHRNAISKYGLTELHRRSFLKNLFPQF